MGAKVTFDSENRLVVVTAAPVGGVVTLDVQVDLYSDMKEDIRASAVLAGNPPAFLPSEGGVPTATGYTGAYYFLNNVEGWRIQPYDADHELYFVGNLQVIDPALPWWVARAGRTIMMSRDFTNLAAGVDVGGGGGTDWSTAEKSQIRDALGVTGTTAPATGGQLQTLDGKVDVVDGNVDTLLADVATVDGKVDGVAADVTTVDGKIDAQDAVLAPMATRLVLIEKIARNRIGLSNGDTGNLIVFDDDSVTPLLVGSATDVDGNPLSLPAGQPAGRSRLE